MANSYDAYDHAYEPHAHQYYQRGDEQQYYHQDHEQQYYHQGHDHNGEGEHGLYDDGHGYEDAYPHDEQYTDQGGWAASHPEDHEDYMHMQDDSQHYGNEYEYPDPNDHENYDSYEPDQYPYDDDEADADQLNVHGADPEQGWDQQGGHEPQEQDDAQNGYDYPTQDDMQEEDEGLDPAEPEDEDDNPDESTMGNGAPDQMQASQPQTHDHPTPEPAHDGAHVHAQSQPPAAGDAKPNHETQAQQHPAPAHGGEQAQSAVAHSTPGGSTLNIALENTFQDGQIYAYVTGKAIDHNNSLFLLASDGKTPYYPSAAGKLEQNVAISLHSGQPTVITIPHIAGGRIYFSLNKELEFTLNEGPTLVEPSVTNPSDPNYLTEWGFVELTFNKDQVYANISYVDFVGSIPTGLSLDTASGGTQHVSGMAPDGLEGVCQGLMEQHQKDGKGWDQLIVKPNGKAIRVISPNQAVKMKPEIFAGYYDDYIDQAWQHLSENPVSFDTQMAAGVVQAHVQGDKLSAGTAQLAKPSTQDVLSCDSGPFATGGDPETNAIIPRIAAAFNRSTLLDTNDFPEDKSIHYKNEVTNHYSRIVHEMNADGKGYAFPYDDVQKTGGPDQSGEVHAGDATLLTVTVGGGNAQHH